MTGHRSLARTPWPALCVATAIAIVTAGLGAVGSATAASASMTLTVNANQTIREVTHAATGSLYGLADETNPTDSLASAIKPNTFVQMPSGGKQQGTGDILKVAPKAQRVGAKLVDRLSDYYAGWPYQFSWSSWPTVVENELKKVNRTTVPNLAAYELWNESDQTWKSANGTYEDFWTRTYRQIRSIDSTTPIQGPSFSSNISGMQKFLENAVATNTVPDIISWHELAGANRIQNDIDRVVSIEKSLGITPRPIAIEEYASRSEVGIPGTLVGYIAKFERNSVHDAELPFWNQSGTLGDLLTSRGGSPNGAYWLYRWYGDMSGSMVATSTSSQTAIDGAAALTSDGKQLSIIFGGGASGSSAVQVNGLSNTLAAGGKVHAKLEQTVNTGRTGASSGATTVLQGDYAVSGGTVNIPVTTTSTTAYRLLLTPTPGSASSPTTTVPATTVPTTTVPTTTVPTTTVPTTTVPTTTVPTTTVPTTTEPTTSSPGTGTGCTATGTTYQWNGGFVENVMVRASDTTSDWRVTINLPSGAAIIHSWNATITGKTGTATATNVDYNANAGGSGTMFGFLGTGSADGMTFSCSAS